MNLWERIFITVALLVTIGFSVAHWIQGGKFERKQNELKEANKVSEDRLKRFEQHLSKIASDTMRRVTERVIERIQLIKDDAEKEYVHAVASPIGGDSLRRAIEDYHKNNFPDRYDKTDLPSGNRRE